VAPPIEFALASLTPGVPFPTLVTIARAVTLQIQDHVRPIWGVEGTVKPWRHIRQAPDHACPVLISDRFGFPSLGVHLNDNGRAFALIKPNSNLSANVSHEILEILVDPMGDRTVAGPSLKPGEGPVEYLVEICDPPEARSYKHDGVEVSDFCTPRYYDARAEPGVAYSYKRFITRPLEVLPEGYLTWRNPADGVWWQLRRFNGKDGFWRLGPLDAVNGSLRAAVDHNTPRCTVGDPIKPGRAEHLRAILDRRPAPRGSSELALSARELIGALERCDFYPSNDENAGSSSLTTRARAPQG
jgi:hypothetical protein